MNKNYTLIEKRKLPELKSVGYLYKHVCGAEIIHIKNDDDNKVFCAAFRTPPQDNMDSPHVLEHCIMNGSKKYQVKDPFLQLLKGSLVTFMNAITWTDTTMYPVASCNDKDFMNLMGVYLDAVFFPLIHEKKPAFLQEGWHYDLDTPGGELKVNGVVYNEEKGAVSDTLNVLEEFSNKALYPDTHYRFNADDILKLTHDKLKEFHRTCYHPSNSLIYFYGNMDIERCFDFMDGEYLSKFMGITEKTNKRIVINKQPTLKEPAFVEGVYPFAEGPATTEGKNYLSIAYVIGDYNDILLNLSLDILCYLLLKTPASPLKKQLMEQKFGESVHGLAYSRRCQPNLTIAVKNSAYDAIQLKVAVDGMLKQIVQKGFDKTFVESCLNRFEFNLNEKESGWGHKGIMFLELMLKGWPYGQNPMDRLSPLKHLNEIKNRVNSDERYFVDLIEKYMLNNPHNACVTLRPLPGLQAKNDEELRTALQAYKNGLSKEEVNLIISEKQALTDYQNTPNPPELLNFIPIVELSDIKKEAEIIPLETKEEETRVEVLHTVLDTDGIIYNRFMFDASTLLPEEIPLLGILKQLLSKLDTKNYLFENLTSEINTNLGGFSVDFECFAHIDGKNFRPVFIIQAKALESKSKKIYSIAGEIIFNTLFDDRYYIKQLLSELRALMENWFISRGNQYAVTRALSYFDKSGMFKDLVEGMGFYNYLKILLEDFDNKFNSFKTALCAVCSKIFTKDVAKISVTCSKDAYLGLRKDIIAFVDSLPEGKTSHTGDLTVTGLNEAFIIESKVHYNAAAANYKAKGYEYTGLMRVLANIITEGYLYQEVRVKGGAYYYDASFEHSGLMSFFTYRDPNIARTYDVYRGCSKFLESFNPDDREMLKYILGAVNKLDKPLTAREKGELAVKRHLTGITPEMVQHERDELLSATPEKIRDMAGIITSCFADGYICTFGGEAETCKSVDIFKNVVRL